MKNTLTLLGAFFFLIISSQAQFGIPSSAKRLGNAKANEKVNEGTQKGLEELLNSMANSSTEVKIADTYSFNTSVDILITSVEKNKKKPTEMKMRMLFPIDDPENAYYGIELLEMEGEIDEVPENLIVFDYLNYQMISLIDNSGQKMGFTMSLSQEQIDEWIEEEEESDDKDVDFRKTGETKNILGYSCDQYVFEGEDGSGEFWVSNDDDLKIGMALNSMANQGKKKSYDMPDDYPEGAILEMNYTGEDGSGMTWIATAIDKKINRAVNTDDYQFMNIGQN